MFHAATLTISGNLVADPRVTGPVQNPDRVTFRVISNHRRRDGETGEWIPAGEYAIDVVCWRRLARSAAQSLHRGDAVRVTGRIGTREYTDSDGNRRWRDELTADFIGLDLSKGISGGFVRFTKMDIAKDTAQGEAAEGADGDAVGGSGPASAVTSHAGAGQDDGTPDDGFAAEAAEVFGADEPALSGA